MKHILVGFYLYSSPLTYLNNSIAMENDNVLLITLKNVNLIELKIVLECIFADIIYTESAKCPSMIIKYLPIFLPVFPLKFFKSYD